MGYIKGEDGVEGVTKGTYLRYDVYTWGACQETTFNLRLRVNLGTVLCQLSSLKPLLSSLFSTTSHLIASPGATLTRPSNGDYRT
jgi:hypothetical protein